MTRNAHDGARYIRYVSFCRAMERWGLRLRTRAHARDPKRLEALSRDLVASGIDLDAESVLRAANAAARTAFALLLMPALTSPAFLGYTAAAALGLLAILAPFAMGQAVLAYPGSQARRRAAEVMRTYTRAGNLMIMSVRHEPSIPKAVKFASRDRTAFARELRDCAWGVLMGRHSSFEEALQELGNKWSEYGGDIKSSLNALVTASREGTEEGKRRALERANNAMISGAKRRIEEYSLSLSTPSMILFGLGILLPLMVGSFLPMLSWDIWTNPSGDLGGGGFGERGSLMQAAILMDVVFPGIAYIVASEAISRHPMEFATERLAANKNCAGILLAMSTLACAGTFVAVNYMDGLMSALTLTLSLTVPTSIVLVRVWSQPTLRGMTPECHEDLLFRAGARMLEGENLEAALSRAGLEIGGGASSIATQWALGLAEISRTESTERGGGGSSMDEGNALEGLAIVRDAASKNESDAGMLAMDLASYIRDLRELEGSLKRRLKPTVSMMRMTAHVLGPIVLGITYAIFISLSSIAAAEDGLAGQEALFLVMALFLAETNAVVCYFVWGIEGRKQMQRLARSIGACLVISELIYSATALAAT